VWWYEDELWYVARIYRAEKGVAGEPENTALFVYELDDARLYHSCDDPQLHVLAAPLGSLPGGVCVGRLPALRPEFLHRKEHTQAGPRSG